MSLRSARVAVVILAAGLVAVAAGCGGGGTKSSSSTQQQTSAATTEAATTSSGSGSAPAFATAKNCKDLAGLAAKIGTAMGAASGNPATALETEAQQLQALADAAPSEIRSDFQTFATAFSNYLHALEKAGFKPGEAMTSAPTAAQVAALTKAAKSFDTAKLRKAEQHLSTWATQNCKGINLGG